MINMKKDDILPFIPIIILIVVILGLYFLFREDLDELQQWLEIPLQLMTIQDLVICIILFGFVTRK